YFANGKVDVSKDAKASLQALAEEAKGVNGYLIQVAGYASAVGPDKLNQKLSADRADAITAILQQAGVPLANVVVPAAMGTTAQAPPPRTTAGGRRHALRRARRESPRPSAAR